MPGTEDGPVIWTATYQVIYAIDEDKHLIVIDAVLPRGTAYRPR